MINKTANAVGMLTSIILYMVFVGLFTYVHNNFDNTALDIVIFLSLLIVPTTIGIVIRKMVENMLISDYAKQLGETERHGKENGYNMAMDSVRMISHKKIYIDEVIDTFDDDGEPEKITMWEYTMRWLQTNKEKRFNKY